MLTILGVDPGTIHTGLGVITVEGGTPQYVDHQVIHLSAGKPLHVRLLELGRQIETALKTYRPQAVAVEKIFLGKNAESAFKLGHARGVILYEAEKAGCEVAEYATRLVKKSLTGKGSAEKEQVRLFVQTFLKNPAIRELDASDALALALHHGKQLSLRSRLGKDLRL